MMQPATSAFSYLKRHASVAITTWIAPCSSPPLTAKNWHSLNQSSSNNILFLRQMKSIHLLPCSDIEHPVEHCWRGEELFSQRRRDPEYVAGGRIQCIRAPYIRTITACRTDVEYAIGDKWRVGVVGPNAHRRPDGFAGGCIKGINLIICKID